MPKDLPATIPARPIAATSRCRAPDRRAATCARSNPSAGESQDDRSRFQRLPGMTVRRADLAAFVRFASRVASRAPMPRFDAVSSPSTRPAVTDLDVALRQAFRAHATSASSFRYRSSSDAYRSESAECGSNVLRTSRAARSPSRSTARSSPATTRASSPSRGALSRRRADRTGSVRDAGTCPRRREHRRNAKGINAVFFQLCRNLAVATNAHVLHHLEIDSNDEGDFLVPRKTVELVENIRKATRTERSKPTSSSTRRSSGSAGSRLPPVSRRRGSPPGKRSFRRSRRMSSGCPSVLCSKPSTRSQ